MPLATPLTLAALAPPWLVLPLAGVVMLIIAGHMTLTWYEARCPAAEPDDDSKPPPPPSPSRVRIRLTNGLIMLALVPLLAVGTSLIDHQENSLWFLRVWLAAIGLLFITLLLTLVDVGNNARLAAIEANRLRREARDDLRAKLRLVTHDRSRRGRDDV